MDINKIGIKNVEIHSIIDPNKNIQFNKEKYEYRIIKKIEEDKYVGLFQNYWYWYKDHKYHNKIITCTG